MKASERFEKLLDQSRQSDEFRSEKAILEYTEEIIAQLGLKDVTRSELAQRLGKNPAFITKLLRGNNNFTFDTVSRIAHALDMEFVPHMKPLGWQTRWLDFSPRKDQTPSVPLGEKKREYQDPVESEIGENHAAISLAS